MKDNNFFTIVYAMVLGGACAVLLTATGLYTAPYREANALAEKTKNILMVLDIPFDPQAASSELLQIFQKSVLQITVGNIEIYETGEGDNKTVAIPLSGPGLWGPIKGFLALGSDLETIRNITFHEQEETPGLGGEIAGEAFRKQFRGKKITDESGKAGVLIVRTGASGRNEVDGISGATMTCDKVQALLNSAIQNVQLIKDGRGQ